MAGKRKPRPKAGSVTVELKDGNDRFLALEFSIHRKKGKPTVVRTRFEGAEVAKVVAALMDPTVLDPDWRPTLNMDPLKPPEVGDIIYVRTSMSIDHGWNDVVGGLARVTEVKSAISGGKPTPFVRVAEHPERGGYNWEMLAAEQSRLARDFGMRWAYPDPDPG